MAVHKHPTIPGRWYIICRNPRTKRKTTYYRNQKTKLPFYTKREAMEYERDLLLLKDDLNITFDRLVDLYLEDLKLRKAYPNIKHFKSWYKSNVKEFIGKKKAVSICYEDIQKIIISMKKRGCSVNYINKNISNIKTILNFAVKIRRLNENSVKEYPMLQNIQISSSMKYWEPYTFYKIIQSINAKYKNSKKTDPNYIRFMLTFAYLTGARKGEIRALKWSDIEMYKDYAIIHFDYHMSEQNERVVGRKNGNGYKIYMMGSSFSLIQEMYNYFSHYAGFKEDDYVFPSMRARCIYDLEKPIGDHTPTRWVQELAKYNHVENITFHGLRHSCVSYLASELGQSIVDVATYIGDTPGVVQKHYLHFFDSAKKRMAQNIADNQNPNLASIINMKII